MRDLWLILLFAGAFQGIFLAFILLFNKRISSKANKYLALLILCVCVFLIEYFLLSSSYRNNFIHLLGISKPFFLLIGPFYFFYTIHLLGISHNYQRWSYMHFIPMLGKLVYSFQIYTLSAERKTEIVNFLMSANNLPISWPAFAISSIPIFINIGYIIFSLSKISQIEARGAELKNGEKMKLGWLRKFNVAFISFWILFEVTLLVITLSSKYSITLDYVLAVACSTYIYILSYLSMTQSKYLTATYAENHTPKYEKSALPAEISQAYLARIQNYMNETKPYTNQNFKLTDLATGVQLSTNHVSQVLNSELGQNFHEFINHHRYEAARTLMMNPGYRHYSLQGIAEEVGFNSKSSFNRNFKKFSGKTPSEFVEAMKSSTMVSNQN